MGCNCNVFSICKCEIKTDFNYELNFYVPIPINVNWQDRFLINCTIEKWLNITVASSLYFFLYRSQGSLYGCFYLLHIPDQTEGMCHLGMMQYAGQIHMTGQSIWKIIHTANLEIIPKKHNSISKYILVNVNNYFMIPLLRYFTILGHKNVQNVTWTLLRCRTGQE